MGESIILTKGQVTFSLREFKVIFSVVVCELEFKYGTNYTEAFTFK
jgi:hypothetical protein